MSPPSPAPPFRFFHGDWSSLPAQPLGDRAELRSLSGGTCLLWRLDLRPGARLHSPALHGECLLSVVDGRLICEFLGNQVELPAGSFVLVPPNVPFSLRATGVTPAAAVGTLCQQPPASLAFEPA